MFTPQEFDLLIDAVNNYAEYDDLDSELYHNLIELEQKLLQIKDKKIYCFNEEEVMALNRIVEFASGYISPQDEPLISVLYEKTKGEISQQEK